MTFRLGNIQKPPIYLILYCYIRHLAVSLVVTLSKSAMYTMMSLQLTAMFLIFFFISTKTWKDTYS
jgi:hypothetical protein